MNFVKTVNLSVRSFLNGELQVRAAALTYQTILALVPMLALVFAIGRGFGFQNLLETQLFNNFPVQREALSTVPSVDAHLIAFGSGGCVQHDLGIEAGPLVLAQDHRLYSNLPHSARSYDLRVGNHGVHVDRA